jgi:hypothetical protein
MVLSQVIQHPVLGASGSSAEARRRSEFKKP